MENLLKDMGKRIFDRRKQLNMTQETLAELAHVTPQTISTAELGQKAMRPETILKVCDALHISTEYLLRGVITETDWSDEMNDIFKDMQAKVGCEYISDLPSYKRKVWQEMKRLNPANYEERQLEDFSKYVFGMSYQTLKDVMKQQKGREEQCRKQGCWWKRKEQLAKKQYHTGSTCR